MASTIAGTRPARIPFAVNESGDPVYFDTEAEPFLLIVGGAGRGKTWAIQELIRNAPAGALTQVIDVCHSGVDYHGVPTPPQKIVTTIDEVEELVGEVHRLILERTGLNTTHGVGKWTELPDDVRPHQLFLFIDGAETLVEGMNRSRAGAAISAEVRDLARIGRSAGVSVIISGQRATQPLKETLLGGSAASYSRLLLGPASLGDRWTVLRNPTEAPRLEDPHLPRGAGVFEVDGVHTVVQVTTPLT